MNKEAFLHELSGHLRGMDAKEAQNTLDFYAESIDDRVEEGMNEEDAVAALGAPEAVARDLLAERPLKELVRERARREGGSQGRLALLLLASPFLLIFLSLALCFYVVLWSLIVSVYAIIAALLIAGAACALGGVAALFGIGAALGLSACGAGLICLGLGLLLLGPCRHVVRGLFFLTRAFGRGVKLLIIGRRG